jgi:hypothetical protein
MSDRSLTRWRHAGGHEFQIDDVPRQAGFDRRGCGRVPSAFRDRLGEDDRIGR